MKDKRIEQRILSDPFYRDQIDKQSNRSNDKEQKPNKYRNEPIVIKKNRFDSKLEAKHHQQLCSEHGERNVISQVSIPITNNLKRNIRIRPDHLVILARYDDGSFRCKLCDSKGKPTVEWKNKAKILNDKYNIEIEILKG